ncbi:hypothetical protein KIH74_18680 [Kineosporia sp. J2-2]|uniref:Uncharacterized protein n=1 Tax=Kineosporia corallincola TaxID=2835133 RepID=A0ABS5TIP0_9ACTN|nr:hypothetical protein [Kineosporia corallincola]MBT0770971.1 hypothetical protein [Kineosporia corallincola]
MTPRISLRPAGAAAVLITFAAVVLTLLSVTSTMARNTGDTMRAVPVAGAASPGEPGPGPASSTPLSTDSLPSSPQLRGRPTATVSPLSHRSAGQGAQHRSAVAALGQSTDIHHPGGSPDVPAALTTRGSLFPVDLTDLPIDASAEVIATTVSISHRGRAPPATGYGI